MRRRAIDRIPRGASVGSLPVQTATRFETPINRETATALCLTPDPR